MKANIQDDNILLTAENKKEQEAIFDFFSDHGKSSVRFDAIITKQLNFAPNGYGSLNISLEKSLNKNS